MFIERMQLHNNSYKVFGHILPFKIIATKLVEGCMHAITSLPFNWCWAIQIANLHSSSWSHLKCLKDKNEVGTKGMAIKLLICGPDPDQWIRWSIHKLQTTKATSFFQPSMKIYYSRPSSQHKHVSARICKLFLIKVTFFKRKLA